MIIPNISVCMATYNGQEYILQQLESILLQLSEYDEVIVVDDASIDATVDFILSIADKRIKLYRNEINIGVNQTFDKAILLSNGLYVFLADQDDIWINGRVSLMLEALKNQEFVASNFSFIDKDGSKLKSTHYTPLNKKDSRRYFKNLVRIFMGGINYYGCAIAFNRSLIRSICPIPRYVESHDLWISMIANLKMTVFHLEDETLMRRIHGKNLSVVSRPLIKKIWSRCIFIISLFEIVLRLNNLRLLNRD